MHAYRRLFARPGVTSVAVAAVLTRLPTSMLGLSLLLSVLRARGSYVDGGLVLTVHAISVAASAPVGGRLADRVNPRAALGGFLGVFLLAVVGVLACLLAAVPLGGLLAAVALLGAATPPAGAVIRANWPRLVDGDQLRTAFAFDGVLNELTYIAGPLAFSLLVLVVEPYVVLCLAGLSMLAGVLVLLRAGTARVPRARGNLMGPLGTPRVLVVLVLGLLDAFLYGCLFVGSAAAAERIGSPELAGLLIGAMSVGAAVGGLGYGARSWRGSPRRHLGLLGVATAVWLAIGGLAAGLVILAVLILLVGLSAGPIGALHQSLIADHAPERYRTEAYAWMNTFMWVGYAAGTSVAGALVEQAGHRDGFLAGSAAAAVSTIIVLLLLRRPVADPSDSGAGASDSRVSERA